uniref:Uncharacterized protein n=1 Tax=Acrobeloides nanus TaxID=290746 RepID=A0A914DRK9_9BILA
MHDKTMMKKPRKHLLEPLNPPRKPWPAQWKRPIVGQLRGICKKDSDKVLGKVKEAEQKADESDMKPENKKCVHEGAEKTKELASKSASKAEELADKGAAMGQELADKGESKGHYLANKRAQEGAEKGRDAAHEAGNKAHEDQNIHSHMQKAH